jgi:hypothetical protein
MLMVESIPRKVFRALASLGVFVGSLLIMAFVCTMVWDILINGRLYFCTDGGAFDFWFPGDWVHHPVSVSHVTPRPMSEPDEIKNGWTMTGLWCLWSAFIVVSFSVSLLLAYIQLHTTKVKTASNEAGTNP